MNDDAVLLDVTDGVATITLNRPAKLNVLSKEITEGLTKRMFEVRSNPDIKVVILTGKGKGFNAGGDINSFPEIENAGIGRNFMTSSIDYYKMLVNLEKPTIAAVNGYAVGAGFSLAISCDLVLAAKSATFSMAFNKMGLVPDLGGLYHLPRVVGMQRAKELVYSGRTLTSEEALNYGICLETVEDENLLDRAREIAKSLKENTGYSIGLAKSMLNQSFETSLENMLNLESMAQAISFTTNDHKEAVRAFREKRKPEFNGI